MRQPRRRPPARPFAAIQRVAFRSPLYRLTLLGRPPAALHFTPNDPWPGDTARGVRLIDGIFAFAGQSFTGQGRSIWFPQDAGPAWLADMHGFGWLRDCREVGGTGRATARTTVANWIADGSTWHPVAWRPDVQGRRLAAWLTNADFLLAGADALFRRQLLGNLAEQARHLARVISSGPDGAPRIAAAKGLILAALCVPGLERKLPSALRMAEGEFRRQLLPDGGQVERNPSALLAVFRDALELRSVLALGGRNETDWLASAIDRMATMLRFFRMGDGGFALFNGGYEEEPTLIDAALAAAASTGKPASHALASGFVRLAARRTLLILDAGTPARAEFGAQAHAGTASFEMSVGTDRMIVNCGPYRGNDPAWAAAARATAAHSTVSVDDTNSSAILAAGVGRAPVNVVPERTESDTATGAIVAHDGYGSNFHLTHRRRIELSADGQRVVGEDRLTGSGGERFVVRFHLHPSVPAALVEDGSAILLRLPGGGGWRFAAGGGVIGIAESIYLGRDGERRRGQQIVVSGGLNGSETVIEWDLAAVAAKDRRAAHGTASAGLVRESSP
ncbi:MAG: hypothetical protein EXQ94_06200 [Alphaproteobacteria bacterium]|nr:hypothetical protein [Alphaproteobacteria bacterium]